MKRFHLGYWGLLLLLVLGVACLDSDEQPETVATEVIEAVATVPADSPATPAADEPVEVVLAGPTPTIAPTPTLLAANEPTQQQSRILYMGYSLQEGETQLRLLEPGTGQVRILAGPLGEDLRVLDWSPDGRWALVSDSAEGTYAVSTDGRQQKIALSLSTLLVGDWSPAAPEVVLADWEQILVVNVETGVQTAVPLPLAMRSKETQLLVGTIQNVTWMPDGQSFIFQMIGLDEAEHSQAGLYRYTVATQAVEALYVDDAFMRRMETVYHQHLHNFPVVSPDGSQVLTDLGAAYGLFTLPTAGGALTQIWQTTLPIVDAPQWSPDGAWIALIYDKDVYLLRADGSEWHNISQTQLHEERSVRWSPDGAFLLFSTLTVRGIYELDRYHLPTGQLERITRDAGDVTESSDLYPFWSPVLSAESLAYLAQAPVLTAVTKSPNIDYTGFGADLPAPIPADLSLAPPPSSIDPPWWGNRFFYRRPLHLDSAVPIVVDAGLGQRPLAQVSFDPNVIRDQLHYPVKGLDIRVVWWGGAETGWVELPHQLHELGEATAVLTFPLQESLAAGSVTDRYYLYYGSMATLQLWEKPLELKEVGLSIADISDSESSSVPEVQPGIFNDLSPSEEMVVLNGDVSWEDGGNGRSALVIDSEDTIELPGFLESAQGTLSFFVKPTSSSGQILSFNKHLFSYLEYGGEEELLLQSLLQYDGQAFRVMIGGQEYTFLATLPPGEWTNVTITWLANDVIRLYLNGSQVGETAYTAGTQFGTYFLQAAPERDDRLLLGQNDNVPGLSGYYFNLFTFSEPLQAEKVLGLYQAQAQLAVTLGEMEVAVATAVIQPDTGGAILSPDGQSWIYFAPGAVAEPTTVSLANLNAGETQTRFLTRFTLYPQDVTDYFLSGGQDSDAGLDGVSVDAPEITVFYHYNPEHVEYPTAVLFHHFDRTIEDWKAYVPVVYAASDLTVATNINQWGGYTIVKMFGRSRQPDR